MRAQAMLFSQLETSAPEAEGFVANSPKYVLSERDSEGGLG